MAAPNPKGPLLRYLRIQSNADRQIIKMLRVSKNDVESQLKNILGDGPGAVVRREQLRLAQAAISQKLDSTWRNLQGIIETQSLVASNAAVVADGEFDRALLRAGLTRAQIDAMNRSLALQAHQAVQHAINRKLDETGASQIPLSERVYRSRQVIDKQVDNLINSSLSRGLTAKEFAKEAIRFIDPSTPGGARFAAMRLSRTEINNAFHLAQTTDNAKRPWVTGQKWNISGSHPKPDECNGLADSDRDGLGPGVYKKGNVPNKPHPQCLCFVTPETVNPDKWIKEFQKGNYDEFIQSNMPVGIPKPKNAFVPKAHIHDLVKNSKFKDPLHHVTSIKNAEGIETTGLRVGEGESAGAKYGKGIYLSTDDMTTAAYERATGIDGLKKGDTITYEVFADVRNPFDIDLSVAKTKSELKQTGGINNLIANRIGKDGDLNALRSKFRGEFEEWKKVIQKAHTPADEERITREVFGVSLSEIFDSEGRAIRKLLLDNGYDSIHIRGLHKFDVKIGGNQLLVFDKGRVYLTRAVDEIPSAPKTKKPKPK